jgi:hypothetical protein
VTICWSDACVFSPSLFSEDDYINYLLNKLLNRAITDPFPGSEALLAVVPYEGFQILNFPGVDLGDNPNIPPRQLDLLLGQTEWPITWDSHQLVLLSSASYYLLNDVSKIRHHIAFWIISQAEEISKYLYTKLDLIEKIMDHGTLDLGAEHSVVLALHTAIHEGGEVIAILTRHLHCSCFPGRKPWIRHRFKKLIIIEKWLTELFRLLLTKGSAHVTDAVILEELCQHAQKHNARTLCAWTKALKACAQEQARDVGSADNTASSLVHAASVEDATSDKIDANSEWETENSDSDHDSEWETEEELDEGQLFERVKDRHCIDATNPDLEGKSRHTCDVVLHEYDEEYWSHLYPCIMDSNLDPVLEKDQEGIAQRLTKYARGFMTAASFMG